MTALAPTRTPGRIIALGSGTALLNAAMGVSSAASSLVVGDRLGMAWAGVAPTGGIVGTAAGSVLVARAITRFGPRLGLALGYAVAVVGGAVAAAGTLPVHAGDTSAVVAVTLGMALLGIGNASAQLSRYVAAQHGTPARRASAIATVVSIATVGAVLGPLALGPATDLAGTAAGAFVFAGACALVAAAAAGRSGDRPVPETATETAQPEHPQPLWRSPTTRRAFAAMAAGQLVMVAIMTATPMGMHADGSGATVIGAVLSAHTFGMFALSPVTAALISRWGAHRVVQAGFAVLAAASLASIVPVDGSRAVVLFALGYGWNLCFIAGSTVLARGASTGGRLAVEGRVDAAVWSLAAAAGLASTALLAAGPIVLAASGAGVVAVAAFVLRGVR